MPEGDQQPLNDNEYAKGMASRAGRAGETVHQAKDAVKIAEGAGRLAAGDVTGAKDILSTDLAKKYAPKILSCGCLSIIGSFSLLLAIMLIGLSFVVWPLIGMGNLLNGTWGGDQANGATLGTIPGTVTSLTINGKTIKIAATEGKVGEESYISGMTFSSECNALETRWYINMRWPYAKWAWNGTSRPAESTSSLYAKKRVIVYNPKNKKSLVTAICESGPAPWTGSHIDSGNPPSYWQGYLQFDPPEYDQNHVGRVAGLAPDAFNAIGAQEDDILQYGFAADQNAIPGTISSQ